MIYNLQSQTQEKKKLNLDLYLDSYYAWYSDSASSQNFQPYTTTSARNNAFSLNVAQATLDYQEDKLQGKVTLQYGDIPNTIWNEDFRFLQEAYVGTKITEGLWLNAGLFTTHIGQEAFLPKDNFLSATTVIAFNEPFYQSGLELSYQGLDKWIFELHLLNGLNRFQDNNESKSYGVLINFEPSEKLSFTYTNHLGYEENQGERRRFLNFHNFSTKINLNKFKIIFASDFATQSNSQINNAEESATMYNALLTLHYAFSDKFALTARGEIYEDSDGFISGTFLDSEGNPTGMTLSGFTLGTEYKPQKNAYLRAEVGLIQLGEKEELFYYDNQKTNQRWNILLTAGFYLDDLWLF